jgi:hypothetical protein
MKNTLSILVIPGITLGCNGSEKITNPHPRKDGYISDAETAVKNR